MFQFASLLTALLTTCALQDPPVHVDSHWQPFFDRYLVASSHDLDWRLVHPVAREVALRFDRPWEGQLTGYVTVLKDDVGYRMYYRGVPIGDDGKPGEEVTCLATSEDGSAWTRPALGLHEIAGTRDNNVVWRGDPACHNFTPFLDGRPDCPPPERYKAVGGTARTGLLGFVSPDGIHFTKLERPLVTRGAFDSQNLVFWSAHERCYVCLLRIFVDGVRWVARATSDDFRTWSEPVPIVVENVEREHLYTNQTQPYFRAPHVYLSTPARFFPGKRVLTDEQIETHGIAAQGSYRGLAGAVSDVVFLTSRGGTAFRRDFGEALIRPGLDVRNWVARANYPALGILPTGEHEMSIWVQRHYGQKTAHIERHTWRTDGITAWHAGATAGTLLTRSMVLAGMSVPPGSDGVKRTPAPRARALLLNVATSAGGSVRVEIQDVDGTPIPGFTLAECEPFTGDAIEQPMHWNGSVDVSALEARAIRLRFELRDADLHAFRFGFAR